jgi:general secretion pathway protein E
MPTVTGERAVLRLTAGRHERLRLSDLGLPPTLAARLSRVLHAPSGMVVCAGPTGAGKTTTLYAALGELDDGTRHLATIEDPVEHVIDGITQIQVNDATGLTFSTALRALLRHDPDVVLLGEIRDRETAQVAVQAALSGHLVLTTLHATDAVAALTRLVDLGVDRYLVAAAVTGVVAQRLLRRLQPGEPPRYEGRVGAFEVLTTSPTLRQLISERASEDRLRHEATGHGWRPLRHAAADLVARGLTSQAEVLRTLHLDELDTTGEP